MTTHCTICIETNKTHQAYSLRKGLRLDALNAKHSTPLEFDCRKANCGICIFSVKTGHEALSPKSKKEEAFLKAMGASSGERLACQCRVYGNIEIEVESYDTN